MDADFPSPRVLARRGRRTRFLLYHRINGKPYDIVKFEIATGKETILYHGGMYPDWK